MTRKLTRAPIYFALVQARFNPILALDQYAPQIQDQLRRSGYPDAEKGHLMTMELKLVPHAGGIPANVPVSQTTRYAFRDVEHTACFVLDQGALTLQTNKYDTFSAFRSEFLKGLEAVHDSVGLSYVDRIGFRCLDAVFPDPDETLADYLTTSVLGLTSGQKAELIHSVTETRFRNSGMDVVARVRIQDGDVEFPPDLVPSALPISGRFQELNGRHAILDTDVAVNRRISLSLGCINTELSSIHEEMTTAFNSTVTQHALDAWK